MNYKLKWMTLICNIDAGNMSRLSRKADITYAHTVKLLNDMKQKGWIEKVPKKSKREQKFMLTKQGKKLVDACLAITYILKESEEKNKDKNEMET